MKIDLKNIKVSELTAGYEDKAENGVRGYGRRLNIRPAFQREFIYKKSSATRSSTLCVAISRSIPCIGPWRGKNLN
jgi:hypothetical protein